MVKSRLARAVGIAVVLGIGPAMSAQAPAPASSPTFDVASVKPNKSGTGIISLQNQTGGRFNATNLPLQLLISQAYPRLQNFQIIGGPAWITSDRFDIVAKGSSDLTAPVVPQNPPSLEPTPMQLALRALLADRFKLVVHRETREMPVYTLALARSDKKLGPGIHPAAVDCAALAAERAAARARGDVVQPPAPPAFNQRPACGMRMGPGILGVGGMTVAQFANSLSGTLNRTVVDQTGLTGGFDIDLIWTPDQMPQRPAGAPADQPLTVFGITVDPNGPSLLTAVQEQLGLKLESTKGPVEVLVIDSVEQPTED